MLTYQQVASGDYGEGGGFGGYERARPGDPLYETLKKYDMQGRLSTTGGPMGSLGAFSGNQARDLKQELLWAMEKDRQQSQQPQQQAPQSFNPNNLPGAPDNMRQLPQGTNSGYQAPANATNPTQQGPSWQAGPQTQELPGQSPFGEAWGGGEGTTYSPITMNQQAALLSANQQAPNQWMNGLLFDSPWEDYYGMPGNQGGGIL